MIRKIITIDEDKCTGCELCVNACHEGAIGMVDGKAKLLRDDYCDGLGDCLPSCPVDAISFEEREALAFDAEAVKINMDKANNIDEIISKPLPCGCPGSNAKAFSRVDVTESNQPAATSQSHLAQWPVQIKLVPVNAAYFENANLLVAADCSAFAYGNFHKEYMKNKVTIIGCPKLDNGDYSEKLTDIISANNILSVTVVRMEVPCCGGIEHAVIKALKNSGKFIPWQIVTISTNGRILE